MPRNESATIGIAGLDVNCSRPLLMPCLRATMIGVGLFPVLSYGKRNPLKRLGRK
jgi:hypothetical protein